MKKVFYKIIILLIIFSFFNVLSYGKDFKTIQYKNIAENEKINCIEGIWTNKIPKKSEFYLVKKTAENHPYYTEFYSPNGDFLFSPESHYEFINDGKLYIYSNNDLNFYELIVNDGNITKNILTEEEIKALFPDFKIIRLTDFSTGTNSLKIKKDRKNLKLILINNTNNFLENFDFTTNNSDFERYQLKGIINITKKGLIQFSPKNSELNQKNWYILLIR